MIRMTALLIDQVDFSFIVGKSFSGPGAVAVIMHPTIQDDVTSDGNLLRRRSNLGLRSDSTYGCGLLQLIRNSRLGDNRHAMMLIPFEGNAVISVFVVSGLMVVVKLLNHDVIVKADACDSRES